MYKMYKIVLFTCSSICCHLSPLFRQQLHYIFILVVGAAERVNMIFFCKVFLSKCCRMSVYHYVMQITTHPCLLSSKNILVIWVTKFYKINIYYPSQKSILFSL